MTRDDTRRRRYLDELTAPGPAEGRGPEPPLPGEEAGPGPGEDLEAELRDYRRIWQALAALPAPDVPERARDRARRAALAALGGRGVGPRRLVGVAAAAVVIFLGGYVAGDGGLPAAAGDEAPRYVLLIRGRVPPEEEARVATRMAEWAAELRAGGRLVDAARLLEDEARWVGATPDPDVREPVVGGYFVVRAADAGEAVGLARTSPHLEFGGYVAVEVVPVAR